METEKKTEKQSNFRLIWSFLKGSKTLFAVCIISAALMALSDMVIPQIIRAAIDNAIGGAPRLREKLHCRRRRDLRRQQQGQGRGHQALHL